MNCRSCLWKQKFLIPAHSLKNIEIREYYQNKPNFNGFYTRDNFPKKIKGGVQKISFNEYADIGNHWIALYVSMEVNCFDSFKVEHVPIEKKNIGQKNIKTNISRIQANNLIMFRYFCLRFIDFMLSGETLINYTRNFTRNENKNHKKIFLLAKRKLP